MAGQHLTDALSALRDRGDDSTADELNDALHTVYRIDGQYLDYIERGQKLQEIAAKLRQVRRQHTRLHGSRASLPGRRRRTVSMMHRDDQSRVDEFTTNRTKIQVPYKCENCCEINEYDPEIAGDAIPCPSCNRPGRSGVNTDEAHMMRPRDRDG